MHRLARISVKNELLLINLCSFVLILIISILDVQALRIVLGLPFLLFFPGYTLVATLFPKRSDLGTTERVALSVGLSVIITSSVGLILNMAWEIRLYPTLISLTIFIAALSATAWYRRRRVAEEDRPVFTFSLPFHGNGHHNTLDGIVSVVLALAMTGAIATLAYAFANPQVGERFTEFYMLGAESFPRELTVGDEGTVVLGIVNHEHDTMSYRVEVLVGEHSLPGIGPIELDQRKSWEGELGFTPTEVSARTKLTEEVTIPTSTPVAEVKTVKVETTSGLEAGDHVMIGQEAAVVQATEDHTIIFEEGLRKYHTLGTEVIEVQRAEFRLFKNCELSGNGETSLGLWVGKDRLVATVRHQGGNKASYRIDVRISGGQNENPVVKSVSGPPSQATGDAWTSEIDYPFSEMNEIQVSLYRDEGLLYRTSESDPYPSVYLWIVVT
jgi:uncharacterized membrane protein